MCFLVVFYFSNPIISASAAQIEKVVYFPFINKYPNIALDKMNIGILDSRSYGSIVTRYLFGNVINTTHTALKDIVIGFSTTDGKYKGESKPDSFAFSHTIPFNPNPFIIELYTDKEEIWYPIERLEIFIKSSYPVTSTSVSPKITETIIDFQPSPSQSGTLVPHYRVTIFNPYSHSLKNVVVIAGNANSRLTRDNCSTRWQVPEIKPNTSVTLEQFFFVRQYSCGNTDILSVDGWIDRLKNTISFYAQADLAD